MTDSSSPFAHSRLLWKHNYPHQTPVDALRCSINRKHSLKLGDYHELHQYSVENYSFWIDLWEFLGIISSVPPDPNQIRTPEKIPEVPIWFPNTRLNYAENLLYRCDDGIAITATNEAGNTKHYSFRQLRSMVKEMSTALRANGLQVGDRVAAIITNSITSVVIALAVASIGGIFSSTATDMGTEGILDRYRQIQPKFVFAETEVQYAGKIVNLLAKVSQVVTDLSDKGLQRAILLPSAISGRDLPHTVPSSQTLSTFLSSGDGRELTFTQLPFNQPLFILYSSGTSGKPKCIVHSAGGVLLQVKKETKLGFSLGPEDTYFQYTTTAWMMWTFMLGALAVGSRIILYDGSPFHPDVHKYLRFINDQGITVFGTSPRFLAEVMGRGIKPLEHVGPFEALRTVVVTGAVLTTPMFEWTQQTFGPKTHVISTSGGTDICSSFVTGSPLLPVYAGEIQAKTLGMKVEVFDPNGNNIEHTGMPGELVCTRPHPSLPLFFWGDENGQKFRDAYFDIYPGIWRQGDFMVINPATKGIMILGRSDGVLNPSGVRFGSGEIYSVMEKFSTYLDDSLCVGQRRPQDLDERVLLFLKMRPGQKFTAELGNNIRTEIKKALSARHVPAHIFEIEDIPYTVNGKKIEIAVKQIVSGKDVQPSGTVANPDSLKLYYKFRDTDRVKAKL